MALPMQKRFSVFHEVDLVNHLRDIFYYRCIWLVFKNSYRYKNTKNAFGFTLNHHVFVYCLQTCRSVFLINLEKQRHFKALIFIFLLKRTSGGRTSNNKIECLYYQYGLQTNTRFLDSTNKLPSEVCFVSC